MDDMSAVAACRSGERTAFRAIYERYVERIYAFVYAKTFHRETAEDIVSETFMKALNKIASFDTTKGTVQAWLYRIASNAVIDHYRRAKRTTASDTIEIAEEHDYAHDISEREAHAKAMKLLAGIDPKKRDIIVMRVWQEMSFKEIADVFGENEPQVKMTFYRAVSALKKAMPLTVFLLLSLGRAL
ncbi:MAG: sigma-70 family RNA polymerase sigma factor [Spirochaetota bacterium]|mgnify:CR=1 FL=1